MTIRVEREALLRVISRAPSVPSSSSSSSPLIQQQSQKLSKEDDEFVIVELPNQPFQGDGFFYDDLIPACTEAPDEDQASVCSLSTGSDDSSSYSTSSSGTKSVSFTSAIVTDVWTREKTLPEDVSLLYYSSQETQTFRQEYRLERKVLNELSIDPDSFPVDDEEQLSNLVAAATVPSSPSSSDSAAAGKFRHRISRVVVLHNDKLETFFNPSLADDFLPESSKSASDDLLPSSTPTATPLKDQVVINGCSGASDFFDNDSFWSGSLTWY